jgi:hypothetical protein
MMGCSPPDPVHPSYSLDGERIVDHRLRGGEIVTIGGVPLRFRLVE